MKTRMNQDELARACGLSRTAVSFALNPKLRSRLRPETQQRILDTARKLGYRPHRQAQMMRGAKSGVIGMLYFGSVVQFAAQRAYQVASAIHRAGYQMLASDIAWYSGSASAACTAMLDAQVEGVVLVTPSEWFSVEELTRLRSAEIPVVALSGVRFEGIPQVIADGRQGAFDLTRHLLDCGYRRLVQLTTWPSKMRDMAHCWPIMERVGGFCDAIQAAGGTVVESPEGNGKFSRSRRRTGIVGEMVYEATAGTVHDPFAIGQQAMRQLLDRPSLPEVVLCSNDDWAHGALAACNEAGLRVPQDIALTGFDGSVYGQYGMVPLTTVVQPLEQMANLAISLLMKLMQRQPLSAHEQVVKLPCQLVVRQSCGAKSRQQSVQIER